MHHHRGGGGGGPLRAIVTMMVLLFVSCIYARKFLESPVAFPIHINVVFVGFRGDGPLRYTLVEERVRQSLEQGLPSLSPYDVQSRTPLHINYTLDYNILFSHDISKYEAYLRNALEKKGEGELYSADITRVETFFDNLHPTANSGTYTIYFVHPNKEQLVGRFTNMNYSYSLNGWGSSQSWVGSGRYAVIDLTAGPVRYGKMGGGASGEGEGAVDYESYPRIVEYFQQEGYQGASLQGASPIEIEAHISSLIMSAVKHLFATDLNSVSIPHIEKLLVPVIVLRNHNEFNPFDEGINMEIVKTEVMRMALPGQKMQVISANHYLHEHPHISIALSKSLRTDTLIEFNELGQYRPQSRPYVDSKMLAHQLREVSDILGQGLLGYDYNTEMQSVFNPKLPPNSGTTKRTSLGTKVLPVYVFSLARQDPKLLLDKHFQVAAFNDLVIVLQTNATSVPVPFFSGDKPIFVNVQDSTKSVIAGIASALGSVTAPTSKYSPLHKRDINDYLWAQGQHPFGHFTNSTKLSQIFLDHVTSNTIIAKTHNSFENLFLSLQAVKEFEKGYYLDPLDGNEDGQRLHLVKRIEMGVNDFEPQFARLSKLIGDFQVKEAYSLASSLEVGTRKFFDYTVKEIETAEYDMICCIVSHHFGGRSTNYVLFFCVAAALVFVAVTVYKIMRTKWTFLK